MNLAILSQIGRLPHNLVKPSRLQKNIGKMIVFLVFKGTAKIAYLYFEMALTTRVGENNAPRTCVGSVVGAY